jgi:hypothetical protein
MPQSHSITLIFQFKELIKIKKYMKNLVFLLLFSPACLLAQRDSLTNDYRTYGDIDTTSITGNKYIVDYYYKTRDFRIIRVEDTIPKTYFADYIDSLITLNQQDSVFTKNISDNYYQDYRKQNTNYRNAKNFSQRLWAIKPD